ncbi:MAG: tripartite tricarboxylate transporter TctB family protein [Bradyrhizobiaceae bacterium]|nr:MAG: tripartite tricarboxylate transporter TctB family protein [Bradyrhizobiaceae bacterium]
MGKIALRQTIPYVAGLIVSGILYHYAQQIEYTPRQGDLGPDFWPKVTIAVMALICLIEIVRRLLGMNQETHGIAETFEKEDDEEEAESPRHPRLLIGGIILVLAYASVVTTLGFLLSTFIFLIVFMYLGRYRNHLAIWLTGTGIMLGAALLFMRVAYVSLPRGAPPFDAFTDFIRFIIGA